MNKFLNSLLYNILYISGIWLLFRFLNRRKILILMYHSVINSPSKLWIQVESKEFDKQMAYLSKKYNVVSLDFAIKMIKDNKPLPNYTAIVTFDDGFKDNLTVAYPILKTHNIPATIFITTSFIDKNWKFAGLLWPDYIYCLLKNTAKAELDLSCFGLGRIKLSAPDRLTTVYDSICEHLKNIEYKEKERLVEVITKQLESQVIPEDYEYFQGLTWDDIDNMKKEKLLSIGSHTISHEILSKLPNNVIEKEIVGSKNIIEAKLSQPVRHFAIPNGRLSDYNPGTIEIAKSNYDCVLTTIEGLNDQNCDLYNLKRIGPGSNVDMMEFKLIATRAIAIRRILVELIKCFRK